MWQDIIKHLADFPSAVLTGTDTTGYPFSVRCKPEPDTSAHVLHVHLPAGTDIPPGPAGLLCHKHDEHLWHLKSFIVRGALEQGTQGWIFRPQRFIPGVGIGGPLGMVRSLQVGRRNAKRYLARRGLSRPKIPWDEIEALATTVKKDR